MLDQLKRLAASLTQRQKIVIAVSFVAVIAGLLGLVQWNRERGFAVLYSNLAAEDASQVVAKLKETGTEYRLSPDGTTIRVHQSRIPDVRLQMAGAGLPKTGRIGFELFDRTNFAITEFSEQVNYRRALEGELERTISTIAEIENARVHITPPKESVFQDHRRPAKASVLLKLRAGRELSTKNIGAIAQLVSNAVDGLAPDSVSVLDIHGNLLSKQNKSGDESEANAARTDYRRGIERDLLAKVNSTLEPLLGPDRFRAAVSVEVDYSTADQSEESFDPGKSVMTNSQRTEDTSNQVQPTGVPGAPSNLPRPTSRPGLAGTGPVVRRSENINYQTSRFVKRTHIPHGTVRRISAGVLLDHNLKWEGQGGKERRVAVPPTPEQLKAVRDVVAGAVGLEPDRGDQLVVESLPFDQTLQLANPAPSPAPAAPASPMAWYLEALKKKDPLALGLTGALLAILLAGGGIMFWKRKSSRTLSVQVDAQTAIPGAGRPAVAGADTESPPEAEVGDGEPGQLPGPSDAVADRFDTHHSAALAERQRAEMAQEREILDSLNAHLKLPSASNKKAEVLARHLQEEARNNPERLAQIVRTWIGDSD
ncbi:MAG: flagellar M-ring protein FliF [Acidobacteria bacterium]|nr:flagellar M-ring protein FliF [Acidobacteriota bacterium]